MSATTQSVHRVLLGLVVSIAAGCRPPPPAHVGVGGVGPPESGSVTAEPTSSDVPIDPGRPMPEGSLSTGATLQLGTPASVVVDGRADVYSSGLAEADPGRGGKLPGVLTLVTGGGYLMFRNVKGAVGCMAEASAPADGGTCGGGNTNIVAASGISGVANQQHTQFLVGLFLGPSASNQAPEALDFSANAMGESFAELAPLIGQTFYIGDGSTGAGVEQRFVMPAGATRLFLGFADAYGFQGEPRAYDDNTGGLRVTVVQQAPR